MITLTIEEYVNGFGVKGYDPKDGYFLNEIHEERIDVLKAIERHYRDEIIKELERRVQNASV